MHSFDLIIFDCDGVLVDSERIANQVFAQILNEEFGLSLTLTDMFETFMGHSSSQCMQIIEEMIGTSPPEHLETQYKTEINQALKAQVTAVRGIEQALKKISIPICVASSGSHEKMQTTLEKTNLLHHFEGKLHSTADVGRGKPSPDVYLYAAERMGGYDPQRCLVIEDSPLGLQGGVAAGMVVFGYAQLMKAETLMAAGAHHIFKDMSHLVAEIQAYEALHLQ